MADIARDADPLVVDLVEEDAARPAAPAADDVVVLDESSFSALPERAAVQEDGSIRLPLLRLVTLAYRNNHSDQVRTEELAELHFRRMNGADIRAIEAASKGNSAIMVTLARASRIPEAKFAKIFDRMDAADISDAGACVERFLANGRRAGR